MRRLLVSAFAVTLSLPVALHAQDKPARDGFWFNIGLGAGSFGCEGCETTLTGLTGQLSLGGTINQHVSLGVSSNGWTKSENGATLSMGSLTAMLRYYPSSTGNFFLTGGLGIATLSAGAIGVGSASTTGTAAILGLGYDIRLNNSVSLTPFWNGIGGSFDGGTASFGQIGLAFTWP
jgi:hypothetical protein